MYLGTILSITFGLLSSFGLEYGARSDEVVDYHCREQTGSKDGRRCLLQSRRTTNICILVLSRTSHTNTCMYALEACLGSQKAHLDRTEHCVCVHIHHCDLNLALTWSAWKFRWRWTAQDRLECAPYLHQNKQKNQNKYITAWFYTNKHTHTHAHKRAKIIHIVKNESALTRMIVSRVCIDREPVVKGEELKQSVASPKQVTKLVRVRVSV